MLPTSATGNLYSLFFTNPMLSVIKMDDGTIKEDFNELYRLMNGMPLREMDKIIYPVCTLCRDHQRSGFVDGAKVGMLLAEEVQKG